VWGLFFFRMKHEIEFINTDKGQLKLTTYYVDKFQGCQCYRNCSCGDNFVPYITYRIRKQWSKPKVEYGRSKEQLIKDFLTRFQATII